MVEWKDVLSIILLGVILYLAYFVFDIEGKNKGKKQPNILKPIIDSLKKLAGWVNRQ
jgi:hypothetical protein